MDRVIGQTLAAYDELERRLAARPLAVDSARIDQAGVTIAVAWHFTQQKMAAEVPAARFPHLVALSAAAESLPEFRAAPHGGTLQRSAG